jgi:Na+-transporting NADH:ubiquinone oxidoreductase subunit NqrB
VAFAYNPWVLARLAARLDRAAFKPATLPDDLITGIALAPPIAAGLIIFKEPALEMLAVALAIGVAGHIAARLIWRKHTPRPQAGPLIAAVVGVALIGAGAGLVIAIEIALLAAVGELLRARYAPEVRAQVGLLAYAAIALITRGAAYAYINPANGKSFGDPIATWYHYFTPASAPIDSIRLYVGNVPGPVFATSLLAVAIGAAWLAYARRLSLVVLITFLGGALLTVYSFHWDYVFQLDSGPTWFVAALILCDRRLLPGSWAIRPVLGFAAGLVAFGLRRNGYGIEAAFYTVAGVQLVIAVLVAMLWGGSIGAERWRRNRRLRQREANLRVVKSVSRAS